MHPEYVRYQALKDLHGKAKELAQSLAEFAQRPSTVPVVRTICGRINEHVESRINEIMEAVEHPHAE